MFFFVRAKASAILRLAGNFLSNDKKSPKNVLFSHIGRCPRMAIPGHARTARILRAITLATSLSATGIKNLVRLHCTKPRAVRLKKLLS
jgi:hypothetical protein